MKNIILVIRLIGESFRFAWHALKENPLRTALSLLGVTVGIFSIIAVLTAVDGLDKSIKKSLSFLGEKVIYVEKWPWSFGASYPWWKYYQRPYPTPDEFEYLKENLDNMSAISMMDVKGGLTFKYKNNTVSSATSLGITHDHNKISDIEIAEGRYFSPMESEVGRNVILIGDEIAKELFGEGTYPIDKEVKIKGIKFRVVGLLAKQGENLLGAPSNDNVVMMPYLCLAKLFASSSRGLSPTINVKGFEEDKGLEELEGEITGLMRRYRGIRPKEEDSFALNRPEVFSTLMDGIIGGLNIAGFLIGGLATLVGGFGIANIMFVSVKERTNLIGIQKSLGAKNYFILLQFLLESVFLSLFGGLFGLMLVSLLGFIDLGAFELKLNTGNIITGVIISSVIGVFSGIVPAISASRMDPVEAIRTN